MTGGTVPVRARGGRLLLGVLLVVLAGCTDDADVPEGWQRFEANGVHGAYPRDWQPRAEDQRGWPEAALEVAGPDEGLPLPPVMVVFAEGGGVPDVQGRAEIITGRLESELDAELVATSDPQVPGAAEGLLLEFAFDAEAPGSADPVPSRQFEVILDAEDGRTFDILLGGPTESLDQSVIDGILDSLRIR